MTLLPAVLVAAMFCTGIALIVNSELRRRPRIVVCPHDDNSPHGRGAKDAEMAPAFPSAPPKAGGHPGPQMPHWHGTKPPAAAASAACTASRPHSKRGAS